MSVELLSSAANYSISLVAVKYSNDINEEEY